jgi:hypothetical protein
MNAILPQRIAIPSSRSRVLVGGDEANPGEVKDDLEKYEHLEALAELFFATKRHHVDVPGPPRD